MVAFVVGGGDGDDLDDQVADTEVLKYLLR